LPKYLIILIMFTHIFLVQLQITFFIYAYPCSCFGKLSTSLRFLLFFLCALCGKNHLSLPLDLVDGITRSAFFEKQNDIFRGP
jgi:hypothetical protein